MRAFMLGLSLLSGSTCSAKEPAVLRTAADPRIELLAVVHVLALEEDPALTGFLPEGQPYADEIRRQFVPFRSHAAVEAYLRARADGLGFPEAFFFMLELGPPPELGGRVDREGLERLRSAFASFARKSRFLDFYESHRPLYRAMEEGLRRELQGRDLVGQIERYLGLKVTARYDWVVTPLLRGAGASKVVPGDPYKIYTLIGPHGEDEEGPKFEFARERWHLWHELSHTLLDDLPGRYPGRVQESESLLGPVAGDCSRNWEQCLREHVAKGIALRLWRSGGESGVIDHGKLPAALQQHPLPYGAVVERWLDAYEAERDRYPTLRDFYPRMLDAFADLAMERKAGSGRPSIPPARRAGLENESRRNAR